MEELHLENKRLQQEVMHLKDVLTTKEDAHDIHIRAYQDTQQRQEEQLTLLEERVNHISKLLIGDNWCHSTAY